MLDRGPLVKLFRCYIDGRFVEGRQQFPDVNPADGSVIAQVSEADRDMVDAAVRAARQALDGEWGRLSVRDRVKTLHGIAGGIEARFDDFVAAEVADTGKPVSLASKLDVPRAAANFRVFADLLGTAGLEAFQTDTADGSTALNFENPSGWWVSSLLGICLFFC
jgi:aminomuconate-semialdehyde/2-hydroxymuconate-6-semialdehyde dehydrogenase